MEAQKIVELAEQYNEQARQISAACKDEGQRVVSMKILFHLPDYPGIIRDFIWQSEDSFRQGEEVTRKFNQTGQAIQRVASVSEDLFFDALEFYKDNLKDALIHLTRMKQTPSEFEIPFHKYDASEHEAIIDAVPFGGVRKFLHHWRREIEGPLHTAMIAHQKPFQPNRVLV